MKLIFTNNHDSSKNQEWNVSSHEEAVAKIAKWESDYWFEQSDGTILDEQGQLVSMGVEQTFFDFMDYSYEIVK
tara:strand:+ start:829 stop:1050 length:222 start_codon:yes stop_codon:yes gene_type:complete